MPALPPCGQGPLQWARRWAGRTVWQSVRHPARMSVLSAEVEVGRIANPSYQPSETNPTEVLTDRSQPVNTLNEDAAVLADVLRSAAKRFRVNVSTVGGATLLDCGIATPGGLEAGRALAEV